MSLGIILKTDAAARDMYEVLAGYDGAKENGSEGCEKEGSKREGSEREGSEREGSEREGNEGKRDKIGEIGAKEWDMSLITRESASFQNGISITSVRMSKGLELSLIHISPYMAAFDTKYFFVIWKIASAVWALFHNLSAPYLSS